MSLPRVVAVTSGSPADLAGLLPGDEILSIDGQSPRDIIQYQLLTDRPEFEVEVRRGALEYCLAVRRHGGERLGLEVHSALFDRIRTCDNHCEFCFIHQLPKGLRKSLYTKDDDYRLSFLYGNFTTLTRFTEADLERVITEGLSPLFVSIHATDPDVRARMLRNRRGAMSLRWLRALLDNGVEVHGQVVVCPEVNDGLVLNDTLAGVLDEYPELASVACVPLGVSRFNTEEAMRPHSSEEASDVIDIVESWQEVFLATIGRTMVYASDELYLIAGRLLPSLEGYDVVAQHDNGVGMIRLFEAAFRSGLEVDNAGSGPSGFFKSIDGAPAQGYRAPRAPGSVSLLPRSGAPVSVLTGEYAAPILRPLIEEVRSDVEVHVVRNEFFGGNTAVAGLMTGQDLCATLSSMPVGRRYLLPDVCLSEGRFLDGMTISDLPLPVEVVPARGSALRQALDPRFSGVGLMAVAR